MPVFLKLLIHYFSGGPTLIAQSGSQHQGLRTQPQSHYSTIDGILLTTVSVHTRTFILPGDSFNIYTTTSERSVDPSGIVRSQNLRMSYRRRNRGVRDTLGGASPRAGVADLTVYPANRLVESITNTTSRYNSRRRTGGQGRVSDRIDEVGQNLVSDIHSERLVWQSGRSTHRVLEDYASVHPPGAVLFSVTNRRYHE
jgi:hypothetical protein